MGNSFKNSLIFWLLLLPALASLLLVIVIPFCMGVFFSFTDWSASARINNQISFVGLSNFINSIKDPSFIHAFIITSVYTVINIFIINAVALALALLVSKELKLKKVYRAGFFLPNLIGGLVLGFIWQFIFSNAIPGFFEIIGSKFFSNPSNLVLANRNTALLALIIVTTWQYAGYIMMIYLAAVEAIPQELIEASKIDGASSTKTFTHIKLPLIAQASTICLFLTLVQSFKQFDVNVSLTSGGPSTMFMNKAIYSTELLALNIYNTAFVSGNMASGQARAVIFFIVLTAISILQVRVNKKKEVEY